MRVLRAGKNSNPMLDRICNARKDISTELRQSRDLIAHRSAAPSCKACEICVSAKPRLPCRYDPLSEGHTGLRSHAIFIRERSKKVKNELERKKKS